VTILRGIAIALNNRGVRMARGAEWQVSNVRNSRPALVNQSRTIVRNTSARGNFQLCRQKVDGLLDIRIEGQC
jgi:hypothetical protein